MGDVLALLDAAIDGLAVATSRCSRWSAGAGASAGRSKYLKSPALPGLPVIPVPNWEVCESTARVKGKNSARDQGTANEYISLITVSTVSTGTIEDSRGPPTTRDEAVE